MNFKTIGDQKKYETSKGSYDMKYVIGSTTLTIVTRSVDYIGDLTKNDKWYELTIWCIQRIKDLM